MVASNDSPVNIFSDLCRKDPSLAKLVKQYRNNPSSRSGHGGVGGLFDEIYQIVGDRIDSNQLENILEGAVNGQQRRHSHQKSVAIGSSENSKNGVTTKFVHKLGTWPTPTDDMWQPVFPELPIARWGCLSLIAGKKGLGKTTLLRPMIQDLSGTNYRVLVMSEEGGVAA